MGAACHFAHGDSDLRKPSDVSLLYQSLFQSTFTNSTSRRSRRAHLRATTKPCNARTSPSTAPAALETDAPLHMGYSTCLRTRKKAKKGRLKSSLGSQWARQRRPCLCPSMPPLTRPQRIPPFLFIRCPSTVTSSRCSIGILKMLIKTPGLPSCNNRNLISEILGTPLLKWNSLVTRCSQPRNNLKS